MRTIRRADQACVAQDHARKSERRAQGGEGPLLHVSQHAEQVRDADWRHHQRNEEYDPEEVAGSNGLCAEQRQAETNQKLRADADEHIEVSRDQRALVAAGWNCRERCDNNPCGQTRGNEPPYEAQNRKAGRDIAAEQVENHDRIDPKRDPLRRLERLHCTNEMILLRAEEKPLVVEQPDESQRKAAPGQREAAQREINRDD